MFKSLPFTPRNVRATESRLQAVYEAARLGLRGDSLALAAGMLPSEYRHLAQLDPVLELAELKGKADGETEMSTVLRTAALNGDAKMALEILKHKHEWVAKQQISVDIDQRISITKALEQAQQRVDNYIDLEVNHAGNNLLGAGRTSADDQTVDASDQGQPTSVRDVLLPVERERHTS